MEETVKRIPGKKNNRMKKNDTTVKRDGLPKKLIEKNSTSLTTLIIWNVKKVLDLNPSIDIKHAIKEVQRRLETEARDVSFIVPEYPEERHLACALLAWQQLGHSDADSLYRFVAEEERSRESESIRESSTGHVKSFSLESYSGPVIKLPIEPKIVMRVDNVSCQGPRSGNKDDKEKDILNKIEAACCKMNSGCVDRLTGMDDTLKDLSKRAALLARREAERAELLERAEAAWRDLERGYKRRVTLSEEKEEQLAKQVQKLIEERNNNKHSCLALTQQLKVKQEVAEKDRVRLLEIEKELSERAVTRQKLLVQSAKLDAELTECQCRSSQLERDLSLKEEQTRRKMLNIESQLDSARVLTHEAERAMRAELSGLRDQISRLSDQLTEEDAENERINEILESRREEKMEMIEDLEGCKELCDGRMQSITDELVSKQMELAELKEKVLECRCKLPRDVNVEVKRTPSLVALCHCSPEQKMMESCSCSSIRGRVLNNLLSDLFSGLQSELGPSGAEMPCQLLKCLEDNHNWDRASIVKSNLKNFFAQLLLGELDIAIANSIEKYHAKWVGENCADTVSKMTPDPDISRNEEGWQQRVIERRAQKLATELAEQLLQGKADELAKQAKDIAYSGLPPCACGQEESQKASTQVPVKEPQKSLPPKSPPPPPLQPCECEKEKPNATSTQMPPKEPPKTPQTPRRYSRKSSNACYTCLVTTGPRPRLRSKSPPPWKQALQDVTQLRLQIEDLKKESIKKHDLKEMETKITKIVNRASFSENNNESEATFNDVMRNLNTNKFLNAKLAATLTKPISIKKKEIDTRRSDEYNNIKKRGTNVNSKYTPVCENDKKYKTNKKFGQTYAINTCLCSPKDTNKINELTTSKVKYLQNEGIMTSSKLRNPKDSCLVTRNSTSISKPISASLLSEDLMSITSNSNKKTSEEYVCPAVCFHKVPSNTSIDKLLETLLKWKNDLNNSEKNVNEKSCPCPANKKKNRGSVLGDFKCINKNRSSINKQVSLNDNLNKSNVPQKSNQQNIIKQSELPENENCEVLKKSDLIEDVMYHISEFSNIKLCKNTVSSTVKTKSDPQSNAKMNNVEELQSSSIPITTAIPVTKTRLPKYPKVSDDNNQNTFNATALVKNNTVIDKTPVVIPTTESEYLGAVNLDKSNEEISKENNNLSKPTHIPFISPFKCKMSSRCSCDKVLINKSPQNEAFERNDSKCLIDIINKVKYEPINTNETKSPCNYNIKFLGVTLTDVKPKEQQRLNVLPQYNQLLELQTENYLIENNEKKLHTREKYEKIGSYLENGNRTIITNESTTNTVKCSETIKQSETSQSEKKQLEITKTNTRSCECNAKLDKFINCIDIALQYESCNIDKSLDVQSFIHTEVRTDSCDDNDGDEEGSKDLEKNAFQLLEEHLKQKLEQFKENSCQSACITSQEEKQLFSATLKRVKQIISDSTNNISCKYFVKDGEEHGSWNRANALLQEYLRIKIKRVQCACSLAKDNKERVLPDVLNKVCNLIDSDFQRLKDVCKSQIGKEVKVREDNLKYEHFEYETPEKDTNTDLCIVVDKPCLILEGKQINKENVLLQVSNLLGMDTKSCDPIRFSNNIYNSQYSQPLKCRRPACNISQKHATSEILLTKYMTYNFPYLGVTERKFKTVSDTNTYFVSEVKKIRANNSLNNDDLTSVHPPQINCGIGSTCELGINFPHDCKKYSAITHDTDVVNNNENVIFESPWQDSIICKDLTERYSATLEEDTKIHFKVPYLGCTIDCSCDPDLGKCVCTKSIFKPDTEIDNVWNKSLAQKNDDKSCYIKNTIEEKPNEESDNLALANNLKMENYRVALGHRQDCETNINGSEEDEVILRDSRSSYQMANRMTNTYDENNSIVTDSSMNEESVDWCDCCATEKYEVPNQLKKSIFFPYPIKLSEEKIHKNENKSHFSSSGGKQLKACNCDMVPMCHVKLLVENIETNLANSKCTCDSMIAKVCPIHSHQ